MGYIAKQIMAAAMVLVSVAGLMEHESLNVWLFNGLGGWICIIVPLGALLISSLQLFQDEPRKKMEVQDWRKNFQQKSFVLAPHLSAQRAQREPEVKRRVIKDDWRRDCKQISFDGDF